MHQKKNSQSFLSEANSLSQLILHRNVNNWLVVHLALFDMIISIKSPPKNNNSASIPQFDVFSN
jgi:hypothetical protein